MIINSHVHFNTDNNFFFYSYYTIEKLIEELKDSRIDIALPCLNPKVGIFRCLNDCSINCMFNKGQINNNLQNCKCNVKRHRVGVKSENGKYMLVCKTCERVLIVSDIDPLRKYNIELIRQCQMYDHILKPILYVSLCESTIQQEIDFYERYFKGQYVGYKLHPWTDQVSVKNFRLKTELPILIHTGLRMYELVEDALDFAAHHENKIIIAHAAQLKKTELEKINMLSNVYVDCCPANFLFEHKEISIERADTVKSPEDIFYETLNCVNYSKILFGSDSPWGKMRDEVNVIEKLKIPKYIKDSIFYKNAQEVYSL